MHPSGPQEIVRPPHIRVFVADSQPVFREGLRSLLAREQGMHFAGEADDGVQAIRRMCRSHPDVGIVEAELAQGDGFHVVTSVRTSRLAARILVISSTCRGEDVYRAISADANGFLCKHASPAEFVDAIRQAYAGKRYVSPDAQDALQDFLAHGPVQTNAPDPMHPPALLTVSELRVLQHTAHGNSIAEISRLLHVSDSTIKTHRQNIFSKLGVPNSAAAVYEAMRRGFLNG